MGKKIAFNVILNLIVIISGIIAIYAYNKGNYFLSILCVAAVGLTVYFKLQLIKKVREEMQDKAKEKVNRKAGKGKPKRS